MSLLYEAHDLVQVYKGHTALCLPYFSLNKGQSLVITGPNGSGKSTLLRLLAFLEQPGAGSLRYYGRAERGNVTLLLQEPYLIRDTVFKNVVLGLLLRKKRCNLKEEYTRAMNCAGFANPESFAARWPGNLSGGEKQRIALASRLILNPETLLLDEPTAYVDAASCRAIVKALENIREQGATVICATHDTVLRDALAAGILDLSPRNA